MLLSFPFIHSEALPFTNLEKQKMLISYSFSARAKRTETIFSVVKVILGSSSLSKRARDLVAPVV